MRVYFDPEGDQFVELAWRDGAQWVSRLIRRSLTKSGRKLVAEAGDPPAGDRGRGPDSRTVACRRRGGQPPGDRPASGRAATRLASRRQDVRFRADAPWHIEPRYPDQARRPHRHKPEGALADWRQALETTKDYPIVQVGAYAGLASPLLIPLVSTRSRSTSSPGRPAARPSAPWWR